MVARRPCVRDANPNLVERWRDQEGPSLGDPEGPENPSLRGASVAVVRVRNRASANPVLSVVVRDAQRERASSQAVLITMKSKLIY
jgi:hypothetical protein